jgi:hypothetical protein
MAWILYRILIVCLILEFALARCPTKLFAEECGVLFSRVGVQRLAERGGGIIYNAGDASWRQYIKALPEEGLNSSSKKIVDELRSAGATVHYVELYEVKMLQVTSAPVTQVFSKDFTRINRAILKNKSDFFISLDGPSRNVGSVYTENRHSDLAISQFVIASTEVRGRNFLNHEYRHYLDKGPEDEGFLKSLRVPPVVQKMIADGPVRSYTDLPDLERKLTRDLFDLYQSHSEVRAYTERLLDFLKPKGFLATITQRPSEFFLAFNDLIQMSTYSISRARASWALDPFGRDTLIFTIKAGAYNVNRRTTPS